MTTPWIIVCIVLIILAVIIFILLGLRRRRNKTVSFTADDGEKTKQLTQQEKSGNYQALGGFQFSAAGQTDKEKEVLSGQTLESKSEAETPDTPAATEVLSEESLSEVSAADEQKAAPELRDSGTAQQDTATAAAYPATDTGSTDDADQLERETVADEVTADAERVDTAATAEVAPSTSAVAAAEHPTAEPVTSSASHTVEELGAPISEPNSGETEPAPNADSTSGQTPTPTSVTSPETEPSETEGAETEPSETPDIADEQLDEIEPAVGRLGKLRGRLARSQNVFGQAVLGMLTAGDLDEDAWEEIEDQLIAADLGVKITMNVVEELRDRIAEQGVSSEEEARAMLRDVLMKACKPELDRSIKAMPYEGKPAVILVVGVNGTGKTTTTGKLARVLVSMGHSVVLGAADTFRAAAADQLETWGRRVGATTVRGAEGADPASVAFDAVAQGIDQGADVVLIDTAGRLHNSANLMDQLGKVKRVVEKKAKVDEVLLVLDATTGQNGMIQARTFADVVQITGVVLTKLDGSAKGGIVFQVQEELGVPVKLVGLGEGADHLAPFEVESFIDALLQ